MNYAKIIKTDFCNGSGIGVSLFVQGCDRAHRGHPCQGCFNPSTWDPAGGKEFTNATIDRIMELMEPDYVDHLSLLGGDPADKGNLKGVIKVCSAAKNKYPNKKIWLWTGYIWEHLYKQSLAGDDDLASLLSLLDVLVDGQFVEALKDLSLAFRGSSNQRIIDVRQSVETGTAVEYQIG